MASVNCTLVGQKGRGSSSYGTSAVYMGYGNGTTHYEAVLSFTTGSFAGKSASITFNIKMSNSGLGTASRTYRWALLSSDAHAKGNSTATNFYYNSHAEVVDENQLAQGTVTWAEVNKDTHKVLTIETSALAANTNYYLVLWPYSTSPTSFITISATQYHGSITVEYDAVYSVELNHCLVDAAGELTWYSRTTYEVEAGASYTPTLITPPSTHTQEGATFKAWVIGWTSVVGEGVVGEDYITVNEDLTLEVYYYLIPGGYVYANRNGTAVKCEVYANRNGTAVKT